MLLRLRQVWQTGMSLCLIERSHKERPTPSPYPRHSPQHHPHLDSSPSSPPGVFHLQRILFQQPVLPLLLHQELRELLLFFVTPQARGHRAQSKRPM